MARKGEMINTYQISIGQCEVKGPPKKIGCKWKDNIKIGYKEIWWFELDKNWVWGILLYLYNLVSALSFYIHRAEVNKYIYF
jgi:hypothetical protein